MSEYHLQEARRLLRRLNSEPDPNARSLYLETAVGWLLLHLEELQRERAGAIDALREISTYGSKDDSRIAYKALHPEENRE